MVEASLSPTTASTPFTRGILYPNTSGYKGRSPRGFGAGWGFPGESDLGPGMEGRAPCRGIFQNISLKPLPPNLQENIYQKVHTRLTFCMALFDQKTNRTGSGLCDIMGIPELSPGCGEQERTEGSFWSDTDVPQSISLEEPETLRHSGPSHPTSPYCRRGN